MSSTPNDFELTSYEEVEKARQGKVKACKNYASKVKDYLLTCLHNAGIKHNTIVRYKVTGGKGVLRVVEAGFITSEYTHEIKFYPFTKSGNISSKSSYIYDIKYNYGSISKALSDNFEVVGEIVES